MISRITRAYIRTYRDTGQRVAYVEWEDHRGRTGRTEARANGHCSCCGQSLSIGPHMDALLNRAKLAGLEIEHEEW